MGFIVTFSYIYILCSYLSFPQCLPVLPLPFFRVPFLLQIVMFCYHDTYMPISSIVPFFYLKSLPSLKSSISMITGMNVRTCTTTCEREKNHDVLFESSFFSFLAFLFSL